MSARSCAAKFTVALLFIGTQLVPASAAQPRSSIDDVLASGRPAAELKSLQPLSRVKLIEAPLTDVAALHAQDEERILLGEQPHFAVAQPVLIHPGADGTWEEPEAGLLIWRLRIASPGAVSLNLGFSQYALPERAHLLIYDAKGAALIRPFTHQDNADHGELWTPVLPTDEIVIELAVAAAQRDQVKLELTSINSGYRSFSAGAGTRSGSCNVDVVCPQGDDWRDEIPASGVYTVSGTWTCSGSMVNNTSFDQTPYFLTADHCGIDSADDASVVVYWNFENTICRAPGSPASGGPGDGSLSQFTTGSTLRAEYSPSDMTLIQMSSAPNPAWQVSFAGWDATGAAATSAVAIHHPGTDEKRISFENQATTTTSYLGTAVPGDGTHVRVIDWDLGTTEPGSSGSPLFNQNHRIIGQLHGGGAACGNNDSDYYGKFSVSWTGGGAAASRLRDWLDPGNTGALVVDTISGAGLSVSPGGDVLHYGVEGGPFTVPSLVYTLTNPTAAPLNYEVSLFVSFGLLLNGDKDPITGTLPAFGGSTTVTVSLGPDIDALPPGVYSEFVIFEDLTNDKTTSINHVVEVGQTLVAVTPTADFFTGGPIGGPFTSTMDYAVTSQRPTPVDVQVSANQPWVRMNGSAGPLALSLSGDGDFEVVSVAIGPGATGLAPGVYHATVTFTNLDGGGGSTQRDITLEVGSLLHASTDVPKLINDNTTISSTLTVPEDFCMLDVDVSVDITHTYIGDLEVDLIGPTGRTVRLHNRTGGSTEDIITTYDEQGGSAPDGPGSLSDFYGEQSAGVWTLRVRDNANQDTGTLNAWSLKITVTDECQELQVIHDFPLNSNPGWTTQGQWAFGDPKGAGGSSGSPDPQTGHSGSFVYGYNLAGDYPDNLSSVQYLTTPPLDCSDVSNTRLVFWRWLGVESATYDHANIEISINGTTWTPIWAHTGGALNDGAWVQVSYDISAIADGASAVRIRWGMGTTDGSVTYCGWNIDDIQILGILPPPANWPLCLTGPDLGPPAAECMSFDHDFDGDVDLVDFSQAQRGPSR